MNVVNVGYWPFCVAATIMLVALVLQVTSRRVPNTFTFSGILAGWIVGGLIDAGVGIPSLGGGVGPAVAATITALAVSAPFYINAGIGAGCVKTQMAFGAWIGCAIGFGPAVLLTAVCSLIANLASVVAAKCWVLLKPDADSFPAQITHSIGSVAGIILWIALGVL